MEFRISFGVKERSLNNDGTFEFNIGDSSRISQLIPVQALIDKPMRVKRRTFVKVADKYKQISS